MFVAALVRPRAALLVALLALAALAAAVLTTPPPASAAPPDDLALTLSLIEDSDNIVPPGGTLQVRATLTHTQDETGRSNVPDDLIINSGTLRVTGDQEWDASGRSLLMLRSGQVFASPLWGSRTGFSVAVMERSAAEGGDVAGLGAYLDTVDGQYFAGSVNLFVDGKFVNRLTGTPNTGSRYYQGSSRGSFGEDLDIGGDATTGGPWIVAGAPDEEYTLNGVTANFGAVYIFDVDGNLRSKITMAEVPGCSNGTSRVRRLGHSVAISDDGSTIVVGQEPSHQHHCTTEASNFKEYLATGFVFTVGSDGWGPDGVGTVTMRNTIDDAAADLYYSGDSAHYTGTEPGAFTVGLSPGNLYSVAASTIAGQRGKAFGDVDISGDGKVIAIGAFVAPSVMGLQHVDGWYYSHNGARGGVMVFDEPDDGWSGMTGNVEETAFLTDLGDRKKLRIGRELAISRDGAVIAAIAVGEWSEAVHSVSGWPGSVMVWQEPGSGWTDTQSKTADLTNPSAVNGRHFGHQVAVSDSGSRIAVADPYKPDNDFADGELHIFDRSGTTWVSDSTPDRVLTSPESRNRLYFGRPALDGENTLVVGQKELSGHISGHGRGYAFDLSDLADRGTLLDDCTHSTLDGTTTWTCDVGTIGGTEIVIPAGTPEGTFTISASLKIDNGDDPDITITDTLEVTIGTVNEADRAEFGFARDPGSLTVSGDEEDYPSNIAVGENTRLRLQILSSEGTAAGANSVSSLLFTTTTGTLTLLSPAGAAVGTCALTCQVNVTKLNAANSGNIVVQLTHPGATNKASSTMVRAQVLAKGGGSLLEIDPVTVTFSGAATKLTISEPATGVLNVNTAAGDTGTDDAKDARETRDRLRLSVSLADANGSNVKDLPSGATTTRIMDPDGKVVWRTGDTGNFAVDWPLQKAGETAGTEVDDLDAAGNRQVQIDVNAAPTAPLKNGEYTLEVKAGQLTDTQTFTVSGSPETIEISEPDGELTIGGRFTLTATLSDADGSAVPDGTPVTFKASATSALPVLVKVEETAKTKDGQASVTYQVVAAGRDSVRVSSGTAGNVILITAAAAAEEPAAPANPADSLNPRMPDDYSSWLGEGATTASALLDGLGDGFSAILLWYNGAWLRYGVVDGRPVPGQSNFEVRPGAILWLTSG